jgi:uncharacterized protein involved in response to NO
MNHEETPLNPAVLTFIVTGLLFMLLPGTFLGVWNLVSISSRHQLEGLSAAWVQAHGHAQIYGWIGTFIIGIGFFSLSKMGKLPPFAVRRAWISYLLWTSGVLLRWFTNVTAWEWRAALPLSAILELAGFLTFFMTVSRHKPQPGTPRKAREPWMLVVVSSTLGFLFALVLNAIVAFYLSWTADSPAIPAWIDQRLLPVPVWAFLVPGVWGFNARWLPLFAGFRASDGKRLMVAAGIAWAGVIAAMPGYSLVAALLFAASAIAAGMALRIFEPASQANRVAGVHSSFGFFVRASYVWLGIAGLLTMWAALSDRGGGIWGASRHAVTVGFLAAMIFTIGPKILPAFCGGKALFSQRLTLLSLVLLNAGCTLRVLSEIPAYEGFAYAQTFWRILPVSALTELTAVSLFALNLFATFARRVTKITAPEGLRTYPEISRQGAGLNRVRLGSPERYLAGEHGRS